MEEAALEREAGWFGFEDVAGPISDLHGHGARMGSKTLLSITAPCFLLSPLKLYCLKPPAVQINVEAIPANHLDPMCITVSFYDGCVSRQSQSFLRLCHAGRAEGSCPHNVPQSLLFLLATECGVDGPASKGANARAVKGGSAGRRGATRWTGGCRRRPRRGHACPRA